MVRLLSAALLSLGFISTATAQAAPPKIFVASSGSDSNDGGRLTPKRSFQAAHDTVATSGNIVVLDTAGYGTLNITKSVAITVPSGVSGFITAGNSHGVSINAGANGEVSLQGLIIEGNNASPYAGILIGSAKSVTVDDSLIRNFGEGFTSISSTPVQIEVHRTAIRHTYNGIAFVTSDTAGFDAKLVDVAISNASLTAFYAVSRSAASVASPFYIVRSEAVDSGIAVQVGAAVTAVVDDSKLTSNTTAYSKRANAGAIYTRGNNTLFNNGNIGVTPAPFAAQ